MNLLLLHISLRSSANVAVANFAFQFLCLLFVFSKLNNLSLYCKYSFHFVSLCFSSFSCASFILQRSLGCTFSHSREQFHRCPFSGFLVFSFFPSSNCFSCNFFQRGAFFLSAVLHSQPEKEGGEKDKMLHRTVA